MRKSNLKKNHEPFDTSIARYRGFMEKILQAQRVIRTQLERRDIAESVLLRVCAHWEKFVDEHIVDCVNKDHSRLSEYFSVTIPSHPTWNLCHALIIGDRYMDFRSFGDLKKFSKKVLPDTSNPFLSVSSGNAKTIDEVYRIRNYLSHYSNKARRSLLELYRSKYGMKRFMEPGQFVLAYGGSRLWTYFDAFVGASADMKAWYLRP